MTIAKPRVRPNGQTSEAAFVGAAPDAKSQRWQRGSKTQVTLSISPELLEQVDQQARTRHLSRAALVTVIINEWLERQLVRNG